MSQHKQLRLFGIICIIGSLIFILTVFLLGLIQPGYNHLIDTISVLVLGKYGWIQNINFLMLAISFASLGIAIGIKLYGKSNNPITYSFLFLACTVMIILLFKADPVDRTRIRLTQLNSQTGLIHISITLGMVLCIPVMMISLIKNLLKRDQTKTLGRYTLIMVVFNLIFGLLWFWFRYLGIGFYIKGLWQKGLALNVLIWMIIMGRWVMIK